MTQTSTRPPLKAILAIAMLLLLGPMWIWNERVAHLPLDVSLQLISGQLIVSNGPIHNWERSWFDGGSSQRKFAAPVVMTIDVRTGRWTVGQQPLVVVQNEQRFTFEDVPSMNGYLVRIEDLNGVKPTRETKVNVYGRPILVNARYLVWSRSGSFEVLDLSADANELKVLEKENFVTRQEFPLKSIPGSNCFYGFSLWTPSHKQLSLFKIEKGRVMSLGEWATNDREVGLTGREILTHSADGSIQIHAVDDGHLVSEFPNPFDLPTDGRLFGRLLIEPGSTTCFDVKTQREISVPFKVYQPQTTNDSVAIFVSLPHVHPSHVWAYDFEKGSERFHIVLPSTVVQASIEGNQLIAVGHAHAITAYTIDLESGKILHTLEPYRITSRSTGLLALCVVLWCVGWVRLQPTGRVWVELALVLTVILFGLKPYQAYSQTMVILLVTSGFALWHACLSLGELMIGISRSLFVGAAGLCFLPESLRSRYLWLLGIWWLLVVLLQVLLPWWLGFRLVNKLSPSSGKSRMSILHLMSLMTIAAVLVVGWRDIDWTWMYASASVYLIVPVVSNGCLLGLTSWLGLSQRRWGAYGWLDAVVVVLLPSLVVVPRLFLLWFGHSIFDGLDVQMWSTWSDFLSQDSSYPLGLLWESTAICLIGPYLLAVALRYGGTVLQKPSKSAPQLGNSGQVLESARE